MSKCTFSVKDGIDKKGTVVAACSCAGSDEIKGKGFLADFIKQKLGKAGEGALEFGEGVFDIWWGGQVKSSGRKMGYSVPSLAGMKFEQRGIGEVAGAFADFSTDYDGVYLNLPPCVQQSWASARKLNLDWNGLGSLAGIEGLQKVEEVTANHNHVEAIPDLNALPSLQKLDLQYNKIPRFYCDGKRFANMKFDKKEIDQIRSCQARKTLRYDAKKE